MKSFEHIIVGGGILGLSVARALVGRGFRDVLVLEKEDGHDKHTSGRNSGVVHQGIYYSPKSLKAKLCVEGARSLKDFCDEHQLRYEKLGKVILPLSSEDDSQLDELYRRAQENGASVQLISDKELKEVEPICRSLTGRALFSPNTAVVQPKVVVKRLAAELESRGVKIVKNSEVMEIEMKSKMIRTRSDHFGFGHVWNAAGLQADRLAHKMGVGLEYSILPFLGSYWELDPGAPFQPRRLIYPVPDLQVPFLGVHFTNSVDGPVYMGPNAMPRLGRENYSGLKGVEPWEASKIGLSLIRMLGKNANGIRALALTELARLSRSRIASEAQKMVPEIRKEHIRPSQKAGMRAQLYDRKKNELVMDFLVHRSDNATNILNAVSPGFTCSLSFGSYVVGLSMDGDNEVEKWNSKVRNS